MLAAPTRPEIDHRTIKLIVGVIAISLAFLTSHFAKPDVIDSISASYYEGGWSQSIFIGFLFAIAALLLSYNGNTRVEMILSKVASFAGLGVALFPCVCKPPHDVTPYVHQICAAVMFLILAYFCYAFYQQARAKRHAQAKARAVIYAVCGIAIVVSILMLTLGGLVLHAVEISFPRLIFFGEATGLIAFGISWLTASRVLPVITSKSERFSPFRTSNPA